MLVPHQPMGLGPWAMGHGESLYPMAQHWVQGLPVVHTVPGSTKKILEAPDNDVVIQDSIHDTSPHQHAPNLPRSRTKTKPKGAV